MTIPKAMIKKKIPNQKQIKILGLKLTCQINKLMILKNASKTAA